MIFLKNTFKESTSIKNASCRNIIKYNLTQSSHFDKSINSTYSTYPQNVVKLLDRVSKLPSKLSWTMLIDLILESTLPSQMIIISNFVWFNHKFQKRS